MKKTNLFLYAILALFLLLCLFHMPYGYYMFVRFVTMALGIYFAYKEFKDERVLLGIIWIAIAVLFQPFFKIALGRTLWNVVDVVVAVLAICSFMRCLKQRKDDI